MVPFLLECFIDLFIDLFIFTFISLEICGLSLEIYRLGWESSLQRFEFTFIS